LFSLQKGPASDQARTPPAGMTLTDWTAELEDFADTAALVDNLDLIITIDTSVAHLAGAMGKPVWTLLPFVPDWRWMLNRTILRGIRQCGCFASPGSETGTHQFRRSPSRCEPHPDSGNWAVIANNDCAFPRSFGGSWTSSAGTNSSR